LVLIIFLFQIFESGQKINNYLIKSLNASFMILSQALDESTADEDKTIIMVEAKNEESRNDMSRKIGGRKYSALRSTNLNEEGSSKDFTLEKDSSSMTNDSHQDISLAPAPASVLASKWESMMHGFKNLKSNIDSNRFLPLSNSTHTSSINSTSSFESLDDIFERLRRPPSEPRDSGAD
jgi:hypothetical protein